MKNEPNINFRKKDRKLISNMVGRFNSKITRILKKNPEYKDFLPNRMNSKIEQSRISFRSEFDYVISKIKRFLKIDFKPITMERGAKTSNYEKREIVIANQRRNSRRKAEREKLGITPSSGLMGSAKENELLDVKLLPKTYNEEMWKKYVDVVEREQYAINVNLKFDQYKDNYIESLKTVFGGSDIINDLIKKIENVNSREFFEKVEGSPYLNMELRYDRFIEHDILEEVTLKELSLMLNNEFEIVMR